MTTSVAGGRRRPRGDDSAGSRIIAPVRIRLELAYLGTFFEGWQVQGPRDGGTPPRTVQGVLEDSLKGIFGGADIRIHGSGRTDSGVHAEAHVAHFDVPDGSPLLPSKKIPVALNSKLPWDVRVLSASEASPDFHARYWATGKIYVYRLRRELLHPHRGLVEALASEPLDVVAMREAAGLPSVRRYFAPFSVTVRSSGRRSARAAPRRRGGRGDRCF